MAYHVKEIYYTLQGEGAHAGRPMVFCRFSGCNLWSGREEDRAQAICRFCDTDFDGVDGPGGGVFGTAAELASGILSHWQRGTLTRGSRPWVVLTGGEPLLQLDADLVDALHQVGLFVAVETNGTVEPPRGIDWLCVSPKAGAELVLSSGDELKLVFPQLGAEPALFGDLAFDRFFLQPMDGPHRERNTELAVRYCLEHPSWSLSLQTHKFLGIP